MKNKINSEKITIRTTRYGTIKRGKVKFKIGSKEDRFLHTRKLPHSHILVKKKYIGNKLKGGIKRIKRYYPKKNYSR